MTRPAHRGPRSRAAACAVAVAVIVGAAGTTAGTLAAGGAEAGTPLPAMARVCQVDRNGFSRCTPREPLWPQADDRDADALSAAWAALLGAEVGQLAGPAERSVAR